MFAPAPARGVARGRRRGAWLSWRDRMATARAPGARWRASPPHPTPRALASAGERWRDCWLLLAWLSGATCATLAHRLATPGVGYPVAPPRAVWRCLARAGGVALAGWRWRCLASAGAVWLGCLARCAPRWRDSWLLLALGYPWRAPGAPGVPQRATAPGAGYARSATPIGVALASWRGVATRDRWLLGSIL
jgi:hypothetical protein